MDNYNVLVEKISQLAKLSKEDIERKVEAKRAKLSGLVSKEGAAQIVAAELGINFDQERLKISELLHGMKRANVSGKIIGVSPVKEFNKNGKSGKVGRFRLADDTSNVNVVLWDTNHISLIEKSQIKEGDVVAISNANIRNGELHLSSFADIKLSNEKFDSVVVGNVVSQKKLSEIQMGDRLKTRAHIVQTFEPRYFEVCPQCGKKVVEFECKEHGNVKPNKRAILNFVIDDGFGTIRAVLFGEHIKKLGLEDEDIFSLEKFLLKKEDILGIEMYFSGNVKNNSLYNTLEFGVEDVEEVNAQELIKEFENKLQ